MLVPYSQWKKPTDAAYAFALRPIADRAGSIGFACELPPPGAVSAIEDVARVVLGEEGAARFSERVARWSGPDDEIAGERPYSAAQTRFAEMPDLPLGMREIERVLGGEALVISRGGQCDYVLRDHHMIDVALYHYRTRGALPARLFHADRHSDCCSDSFLEKRRPDQAATWWKLFEGLKRPEGEAPVLREEDVNCTMQRAPHEAWMSGRDLEEAHVTPWFYGPSELTWQAALARESDAPSDWVSLDLDYFLPSPQLRMARGLLRDPRFAAMMKRAPVRVFVLSPQFLNGGDKHANWRVRGHLCSALRLLHLLRRAESKQPPGQSPMA